MKTSFLTSILVIAGLLAGVITMTAADPRTFWVEEEGPTVSFHVASTLSEYNRAYPAWVVSMTLVATDIAQITAKGQIQSAKAIPDPQAGDIVLEFTRIAGSKLDRKRLVEMATARLNKGAAKYKEADPAKCEQVGCWGHLGCNYYVCKSQDASSLRGAAALPRPAVPYCVYKAFSLYLGL